MGLCATAARHAALAQSSLPLRAERGASHRLAGRGSGARFGEVDAQRCDRLGLFPSPNASSRCGEGLGVGAHPGMAYREIKTSMQRTSLGRSAIQTSLTDLTRNAQDPPLDLSHAAFGRRQLRLQERREAAVPIGA
jgi:hypothetical protein